MMSWLYIILQGNWLLSSMILHWDPSALKVKVLPGIIVYFMKIRKLWGKLSIKNKKNLKNWAWKSTLKWICVKKKICTFKVCLQKYFKWNFIEYKLWWNRSSLSNLLATLDLSSKILQTQTGSVLCKINKQINKSRGGIQLHNLIWLEVDVGFDLLIFVCLLIDLSKE